MKIRSDKAVRVAAEKATGKWWCHAGQHHTSADPAARRGGRRICPPCAQRIGAMRRERKA